jgi:hypothetical protein
VTWFRDWRHIEWVGYRPARDNLGDRMSDPLPDPDVATFDISDVEPDPVALEHPGHADNGGGAP